MRPQKQLFRHDPANEIWGDCFRTCIAIILDRDAADVPHFMDCTATPDPADRDHKIDEWLGEQGLRRIEIYLNGAETMENVMVCGHRWGKGMPWMLSGMSRTPANHVVVCRGTEIFCDPSLTDAGIVGPMDNDFWCIEYIVRAL